MTQDRPGVQMDNDEMNRFLQTRPVGDAAYKAGRNVQSVAERLAPKESGSYSRAFQTRKRLVPSLSREGGRTLRAGAEVINTAPHAARVEASRSVLQQAAKRSRSR